MNALTAKEAEAWTSEMARVVNVTIRGILEAADLDLFRNFHRIHLVLWFSD